MRLINVRTLQLEEYFGSQIPSYAILSHCWSEGEVTFQDINGIDWQDKPGPSKSSTPAAKPEQMDTSMSG
jgi:hypothetical protein